MSIHKEKGVVVYSSKSDDAYRTLFSSNGTLQAKAKLIRLPQIQDVRGNLTFIESNNHIPFSIKRVYYLYDVPSGAERAAHAHYELKQILIAVSGSFDVHIENGEELVTVHLNRPDVGLYIDSMVWREIDNFSGGAVCICLASEIYDESDYIRDKIQYQKTVMDLMNKQ